MGGVGEKQAGKGQGREREEGRYQKYCVTSAVISFQQQDECHEQRPDRGASLIKRIIDSINPSLAKSPGGVGKHCFNGGLAQRPSDPFHHHEHGCDLPVASERKRGNGKEIDTVPDELHQPVFPGSVAHIPCNKAQAISKELPDACDDADGGGTGPEHAQELSVDAARAFVGYVGEQIDHAEDENEFEGIGRARRGLSIFDHLLSSMIHCRNSRLSRMPRGGFDMARKSSRGASKDVEREMRKFKRGTLNSKRSPDGAKRNPGRPLHMSPALQSPGRGG